MEMKFVLEKLHRGIYHIGQEPGDEKGRSTALSRLMIYMASPNPATTINPRINRSNVISFQT